MWTFRLNAFVFFAQLTVQVVYPTRARVSALTDKISPLFFQRCQLTMIRFLKKMGQNHSEYVDCIAIFENTVI
jgi:hypothetical protein